MNLLDDYYHALERLKQNKPIRIPLNSKINNDTVSLEAGRKRGSIKKSREQFTQLCIDIKEASRIKNAKLEYYKEQTIKYKNKYKTYKSLYQEALNREFMLILQLQELEKEKRGYSIVPVNIV